MFRGDYNDSPPTRMLSNFAKKYGPIFTLWIGPTPLIFVNNYELTQEALVTKKNDFINKSNTFLSIQFNF